MDDETKNSVKIELKDLKVYENFSKSAKNILKDWKYIDDTHENDVKTRRLDIDVDEMRDRGELTKDKTIIPSRVVHRNIQSSMPLYIRYLRSPRVAVFNDVDEPGSSGEKIMEREFSRCFKYPMWDEAFNAVIDGAHMHGWDSLELLFGASYPGQFYFEHVGHNDLIFVRGVSDIQSSPIIMRRLRYNADDLVEFVNKHEFSSEQVRSVVDSSTKVEREAGQSITNDKKINIYTIYKVMYKDENGHVMVGWYSPDCEEWLREPRLLYIGVDEVVINSVSGAVETVVNPETEYPYALLYYASTSDKKIEEHFGRVFYDTPDQDAETALWSSLINGVGRATNIYGSPSGNVPVGDGTPQIIDVKLEPDSMYNNAVRFWNPPYPDNMILNAITALRSKNQMDTGQVDYAAGNRKDSRKTAQEIMSADTKAAELDTVQVVNFSRFMLQCVMMAWRVVRARAVSNKIKFARLKGNDGSYVNNIDLVSRDYQLLPAGDTDVIQRMALMSQMRQDMPLVSGTSVQGLFLARYLRLAYPDDGEKYAKIIEEQGSRDQAMVRALGTALEAVVGNPEIRKNMPPDTVVQINNMLQQAGFTGGVGGDTPPADQKSQGAPQQ